MSTDGSTQAAQARAPEFRHEIDPEYFALTVRRAVREQDIDPDPYPVDYLDGIADPDADELTAGEVAALEEHPEVVEADQRALEAATAVLAAEDAGQPDELAQRRLDRARQERRELLVRLQKARTAVHTRRAGSRAAQVLPLRPFRVIRGGEAA